MLYYTTPYCTMLYYTILYHAILYYTILYCTMLYYTIPYYTVLCYTILYCTMLYYTIPYYAILYYTILYYIILYYSILYYVAQFCVSSSSYWYFHSKKENNFSWMNHFKLPSFLYRYHPFPRPCFFFLLINPINVILIFTGHAPIISLHLRS